MPLIPPAGITAASFFVPTEVISTGRPAALLCDWIDPKTGDIKSLFASPSPVTAAFQHAFTVQRNSGSSVREAGQEFFLIKKNDDTAFAQLRDESLRIAKPFIDRGHIKIESIFVANSRADLGADDMGAVVVNFHDLVFDRPGSLTL